MKIKLETIKRVLSVAICFSVLLSGAPLLGTDFSSIFSPEAKAAEVKTTEDGFMYRVIADTIHIVGYEGSGGDIEIPGTIEGKPVYVIQQRAFAENDTITSVTLNENLQLIRGGIAEGSPYYGAFVYCKNLKTINIPDSVIGIGDGAFAGCTSLESVSISENSELKIIGIYAFSSCRNLKSIYIPDSTKEIEQKAFAGCESLTTVTGFRNVESIGADVFEYTKIYNGEDIRTWKDYETPGEVYIGSCLVAVRNCGTSYQVKEDTKTIGSSVFYKNTVGNRTTTEILLPESLKCISPSAFYGCEALESINIPANVEIIGNSAFSYCYALESVTFAENSKIKEIQGAAFKNCTNLTSVEIPYGIELIGDSAFSGTKVTELTLPDSLVTLGTQFSTSIEKIVFSGDVNAKISDNTNTEKDITIIIEDGAKRICKDAFKYGVENIEIPDSIEIIESNALTVTMIEEKSTEDEYGNKYIGKCLVKANSEAEGVVTVKSDTVSVGSGAFSGCKNITKITGLGNVVYIGYGAFNGCGNLMEIDNLNSVKYIDCISGNKTFGGCGNLIKIGNLNNLEYLEENVFKDTVKLIDESGYVGACLVDAPYNEEDSFIIKEGTRVIAPKAFARCSYNKIIIPDSVTCIGYSAFGACKNLKSIEIPGNVKTICEGAFSDSDNLTTIIIKDGVESIRYEAFANCDNLERVHIPASLTYLDNKAFNALNGQRFVVCFDSQNTYAEQVAIENSVPFIYCDGNHVIESEPDTPDTPAEPETILLETDNKNVAVEFDGGLFGREMWLDVSENVPDDVKSSYEISSRGEPLAMYMICLKEKDENGNKTDVRATIPEGESVTVKIKNPKSSATRFYIVHIDLNGNPEAYNSDMIRTEGDYLVFDVRHFSYFAVYEEKTVKKTVLSISIANLPSKTSYLYKGGEIDLTGLSLTVAYTDGSTETISDTSKIKVTGFDSAKIGTQSVTVEYEDFTADFEVAVSYSWWQWIIRILLLGFLWY